MVNVRLHKVRKEMNTGKIILDEDWREA